MAAPIRSDELRIGATFPQTEIGDDPIAVRDFAQAAEDLGYSHLIAYDHVLGAAPAARTPPLPAGYSHLDPFHEPLVLFGFLAGVTRRIELATGILVLPQRQTALVAKQAAEVAMLSRGRLRLGVGVGWNHVEYEALNARFSNRGSRLGEQIELLRLLWSEPLLDYRGDWHRVDRAALLPRPAAPIPIWCGGQSDAALRRGAQHADGFIFGGTVEQVAEHVDRLLAYADGCGRADGFGVELFVEYGAGPGAWAGQLERCRRAGVTHVAMRSIGTEGIADPQGHIDALGVFARELGLA